MPVREWHSTLIRCPKQFEARQFGTSLRDAAKVAPKLADVSLRQQADLREQTDDTRLFPCSGRQARGLE